MRERLGWNRHQKEGLTTFLRCVLVHVFRHGQAPAGQTWRPPSAATSALTGMGILREADTGLELIHPSPAAAGVLEPRCHALPSGQKLAADSDACAGSAARSSTGPGDSSGCWKSAPDPAVPPAHDPPVASDAGCDDSVLPRPIRHIASHLR